MSLRYLIDRARMRYRTSANIKLVTLWILALIALGLLLWFIPRG